MFYYLLNIKALSNFVQSYKPHTSISVKFDNDCTVIFMFKI